ncbi:MAG: hypothetical protein KJ941_09540 [Bacteroidetes bacterium]|nr:hypothetical protein [Bacteroidota bacterium]
MKEEFDILNKIKKVEAPDSLWNGIQMAIHQPVAEIVPISWIRLAAAILVLSLVTEIYTLVQTNQSYKQQEISSLVNINQNALYHE